MTGEEAMILSYIQGAGNEGECSALFPHLVYMEEIMVD